MFLLTFFDCASQFRSWPIDQHSSSILSKAGYGLCVVAKLCRPVPLMVAAALTLVSTLSPTIADTDAADGLRSMLFQFGFSAEHLKKIERGAIVSANADPALPNELTAVIAMRLPIRIGELAVRIRSGVNIIADRRMTDYGELDPARGEADLEGVAFSPNDRQEFMRLFKLQPGAEFNLSAKEIDSIRERLGAGPTGREAISDASAAYRLVLAGRLRGYRERGLSGLAAYDRGDGFLSSPGEELSRVRAALAPIAVLAPLLSELDAFPRPLSSTIHQRFFWKKTEVDGRPTFILSHVLLEEKSDVIAFVLREFYVGHSYNVLQQVGVALPQGEESVVLALNSTVTDRIPGFLGGVARAIGQRRAREALEAYFDGIRSSVSGPARGW
jgi:hypothetical protein